MQYRRFGKLDWQGSALGFGAMRLPTLDHKPMSAEIETDAAVEMIRYAIDQGVNYVDTAFPYHMGNSEVVVGKALQDGYRARVKLATKAPVWFIKQAGDFDRFLNEQLKRLQTDHIDFYLFHGLDKAKWDDAVLKLDLLERAEAAVKNGLIGHIGFSFHDNYEAFQQIVDGYEGWTFCQIQYNFMDVHNQAGLKGLQYAADRGLAVIVMEPLLGGRLANPPGPVADFYQQQGGDRTPAEWALQWLWNQAEVAMILSGMSTLEQVKENVQAAERSGIDSLSFKDLFFVEQVRRRYEERMAVACTNCGYCLPCPHGVNIPGNFQVFNNALAHNDVSGASYVYQRFMAESERAGQCSECALCEELCPQQIPISQWLARVHEALSHKHD